MLNVIDVWTVSFTASKYDEQINAVYRTREAAYKNEHSEYCSVDRRKAIVDESGKVYLLDENHSNSFELKELELKIMKLFLDDEREAPKGWIRVYDVNQLIHMVMTYPNIVEQISLDNDLGDLEHLQIGMYEVVHEGYQFVNWLEDKFHDESETYLPKLTKVNIHSANPVARDKMSKGMQAINGRFNGRQIEVTVVEFQHL